MPDQDDRSYHGVFSSFDILCVGFDAIETQPREREIIRYHMGQRAGPDAIGGVLDRLDQFSFLTHHHGGGRILQITTEVMLAEKAFCGFVFGAIDDDNGSVWATEIFPVGEAAAVDRLEIFCGEIFNSSDAGVGCYHESIMGDFLGLDGPIIFFRLQRFGNGPNINQFLLDSGDHTF